jgi:signal peptidase I
MDYRKPRRGEVIVFIYPKEPDKDFIKRIVAVAGDTVELREDRLFVNGKEVPRKHLDEDCRYEDYKEDTGRWEEVRCEAYRETVEGNSYTTVFDRNKSGHSTMPPRTVPPESVFVMGDNRDNSHDSRYWGFVPFDLIKGKAMIIWWSLGEPEGVRAHRLFHLVE